MPPDMKHITVNNMDVKV